MVTIDLERIIFSKWDNTISKTKVKEDRRGCSFALINFKGDRRFVEVGGEGHALLQPFHSKVYGVQITGHEEALRLAMDSRTKEVVYPH